VATENADTVDEGKSEEASIDCERGQAVNLATAKFCNQCRSVLKASTCPGQRRRGHPGRLVLSLVREGALAVH
jgi:hypothetical protein